MANMLTKPVKLGRYNLSGTFEAGELLSLAVGGGLYGLGNRMFTPILASIPGMGALAGMLGGTVPNMILASVANVAMDQLKINRNAGMGKFLSVASDGLLGAAIVGLGVHLSQGLAPLGLSGVRFYPGRSGVPGSGRVDFGSIPAGLGNVQFTREAAVPGQMMGGVDFTPGADSTQANFGMGDYEQSASDFGGMGDTIPQGMT